MPFVAKKLDKDDPDHISWLYNIASARAAAFDIEGVTYALTQGVVKNIIPAVASTNAMIAGRLLRSPTPFPVLILPSAACSNEAFKIATSCAPFLNNYFMLIATEGVYTYTFEHEARPDCPVCGGESLQMSISRDMTVEQLIEALTEKQSMYVVWLFCSCSRGDMLV